MSMGRAIGLGLLVGLVVGGAGFLVTRSIIYLWIAFPLGVSYALLERSTSGGVGRFLARVGLSSAVMMAVFLILHRLYPPTR